ncbi:hypothetical protein [Ralstonia phage phiRSL1]|uniref:Uncharacterized protein n=1 Tax=Ralstonia phage phiRSL1 TaxID=1980924 RepID=B2ZYA1_9CAUD|nr:hypothetical protein RSL1_ORF288 [Ralstonia phage phiRSL1]BAG41734.1 hypothetical protein [Ralstonia phage phiRSL1]
MDPKVLRRSLAAAHEALIRHQQTDPVTFYRKEVPRIMHDVQRGIINADDIRVLKQFTNISLSLLDKPEFLEACRAQQPDTRLD